MGPYSQRTALLSLQVNYDNLNLKMSIFEIISYQILKHDTTIKNNIIIISVLDCDSHLAKKDRKHNETQK